MTDVIGIFGFALSAAYKVYTVIQSVKDAPGDIQALRDDAFQVHGFLKRLLKSQHAAGESGPLRISDSDVKDPQIDALVKKAKVITAEVDTLISKTTVQTDDGMYVVKKLKWPL